MNLRSLIRPSAAKWAKAKTLERDAQFAFEATHSEPYDHEQREKAVLQRATRRLHLAGHRL